MSTHTAYNVSHPLVDSARASLLCHFSHLEIPVPGDQELEDMIGSIVAAMLAAEQSKRGIRSYKNALFTITRNTVAEFFKLKERNRQAIDDRTELSQLHQRSNRKRPASTHRLPVFIHRMIASVEYRSELEHALHIIREYHEDRVFVSGAFRSSANIIRTADRIRLLDEAAERLSRGCTQRDIAADMNISRGKLTGLINELRAILIVFGE